MAYTKTVWKNRQVENPRTYTMTENGDGTVTLERAPGEVYEVGTPMNADNMNHLEEGVFKAHEKQQTHEDEENPHKGSAPLKHAAQHAKDGQDPIAPDMIGAALAGYGYGDNLYVGAETGESITDKIDALMENWESRATKQYLIYDADFSPYAMQATISKYSETVAIIYGTMLDGRSVIRRKTGGVWQPWVVWSSSDFAPSGYGLGGNSKEIDDWNAAIKNGFYRSSASCINGPVAGSQYHGMMINYSSALGNQFVFKTWTDGQVEIWSRRYYNGTFAGWKPVLTSDTVGGYAAPAGYTVYSGYFSSEDMLNTRIANAYAGIADDKIGFAEMDSTSNAPTLKSGKWFFTIYRQNADYGFMIAESLTANGTSKYQRTLNGGTWSDWVDVGTSAFAPSGYGLGLSDSVPLCTNANDAWQNGWFKIDSSTQNGVGVSAIMRVDARASAYSVCQTAYSTSWSSAYPAILQRWCMNGTWDTEWSWVNPPMSLGVEYRTTERWGGNVVYAKCVSGGSWLDQKTINIPVENCYRVTRFEAVAGDYCLPFIYQKDLNGKYTAYVRVMRTSTNNISVTMCGGLDGNEGTYATAVTVFYAKNE